MGFIKKSVQVGKQTFKEFSEDNCPRMAAALSYYTVFSLPPLLILLIMIAGIFVDPEQIRGSVERQMAGLLGPRGASAISDMIANASKPNTGNTVALIISIVALLFSATGAFSQLQNALDTAWQVAPDPNKKNVMAVVVKRLFSMGMIVVIAFLLLVSLVLSAAVQAFGGVLSGLLGGVSTVLITGITYAVSLLIVTLLFAAVFKVLPDAKVKWKDVWPGAFMTAVLFEIGKFLIGLYISRSDPGSKFGAAGSLVIVLLWVYFAGLILFLGAEFTQVRAKNLGREIIPKKGSVHVENQVKYDFGRGEA